MGALLDKLFKALRISRRRASRVPRDQQAYLFVGVAPLGPARLIDLSATGARVETSGAFPLAEASRLLIMESSQLLDVEPAWTTSRQAGFKITASNHLRGYTEGEAEQIKAWWTAHRLEVSE